MRIPSLVATLMLGGISCAFAQDGPPEKMRGSEGGAPSIQESDRGSDATTNRSSQGEQKSSQSDRQKGSSKARSAEKSETGKSEEPGGKGRSAEEKSDTKQRATKSDDSSGSRQSRSDDKNSADKSAKENDKSDTSNKSASDTREQPGRKTGEAGANDMQKNSAGSNDTQKTAGDKASPDSAKRVELTGDKRTRVQTAFKSVGDVKHRTHVDIHISVGTRLPRDWEFVPVPVVVLDVVPEYRGYVFAYVDDQYVICDPDSYEVVAVLPAERGYAGASSGRSDKCSTQLSLNSDTRKLILQSVRGGREIDVLDLSVGRRVPRDVELLTFPDNVISEARELSACRYFDAGDQIAIVNPDEDKIVLVIDKG